VTTFNRRATTADERNERSEVAEGDGRPIFAGEWISWWSASNAVNNKKRHNVTLPTDRERVRSPSPPSSSWRSYDRLRKCPTLETRQYNYKKKIRDGMADTVAPSTASQRYDIGQRVHSLQLPEHSTHLSDCNFLTRMLYKNKY